MDVAEQFPLNRAQREAVEHGEGPLLVLSGAGSGKTRVIVHRIAHLVEARSLPPDHILAVTFTNKAAHEMASRVERLLPGIQAAGPWISTFHSLCARFLRREAPHIGLTRSFTIFDEDDQRKMLKEIAQEMEMPHDGPALAAYQAFVERARNRGWLPLAAYESGNGHQHEQHAELYRRYHERMRQNGTLDFGDLILAVIECLEKVAPVRDRYLAAWEHILVDEFQDTNPAQYKLLRLLTRPPFNVTAVGDDDQSIYAWRGASVQNLLGFASDFPDCRVVRLEQNYRSTQAILDLANCAISANRARLVKVLWTDRGAGTKPIRFTGADERAEAGYVAQEIRRFVAGPGRSLGDIALFYRTNAQSRIYEEHLRRLSIPYRVVAGTSFYEREEVKDILAYLRLAVNPRDDIATGRIINVPRRGVGAKTVDTLRCRARQKGISLWAELEAMLAEPSSGLKKKARESLGSLQAVMSELKAAADRVPPSEAARWLVREVAYREHLDAVHPENAEDRFDNIQELISAIRDYEEDARLEAAAERPSLQGFLESCALVQAADDETAIDAVNLMTIHAAKGLEFPVVFLTGLEDGLIPLIRSGRDEPEDVEEERRLFYVAATRAKQRLYLTDAVSRRLYGSSMPRQASRFLDTLSPDLVEPAVRGLRRPRTSLAHTVPVAEADEERGRLRAGASSARTVPVAAETAKADEGQDRTRVGASLGRSVPEEGEADEERGRLRAGASSARTVPAIAEVDEEAEQLDTSPSRAGSVPPPVGVAEPRSRIRQAIQAKGERRRRSDSLPETRLVDMAIPPDGLCLKHPSQDSSELDELVGRTARHRTFGDGRIVSAEYSGERIKLTIVFPGTGTKSVIRSFVDVL